MSAPLYSDARSRGFAMTLGQAVLTSALLGAGLLRLLNPLQDGSFSAAGIFVLIVIGGLAMCDGVRRRLQDPRLGVLKTFWLIKVGVTLFLLYVGWIPQLDPATSPAWGYDPQRYFYDAYDLIENGWNPLLGSNYQGIIFYYAGVFYVFGHNPAVPALLNAFITLLATLYLIRIAYEFKPERTARDWHLAWLLLIPEVLWYDVLTSRETMVAALILFGILPAGRYLLRTSKVSLPGTVFLTAGAMLGILAVRTTMAVAVLGAIGAIAMFLRSGRKAGALGKVFMLLIVAGLLLTGPLVQKLMGGVSIDVTKTAESLQSGDSNVAAMSEWSDNSVGQLLSPSSPLEAVLFTLPRMVLYLAAPLPDVAVPIEQLVIGSWSVWQKFMTLITSLLNMVIVPFVIAGALLAWRRRKSHPAPLVIYIALAMTFVAIVGGNIIIHERYRLMMTLLLFTAAWLGYTQCTIRQVRPFGYAWAGLLMSGALFYIIYKTTV